MENGKDKINTNIISPVEEKSLVNIAILGGAFNPITLGHIQIASYVLESSHLVDEVWIMPCYKHIYNKKMAGINHRLEMCRIAASKDKRVKVSDYEIKNEFQGGTYYLIKQFLNEDFVKNTYRCSLIIGQDNANTFTKWVKHEELKQLIRFIVIPRKGVKRDFSVNWYLTPPHTYLESKTCIMEVSSTQVRTLLEEENYNEAGTLLDPDVLFYIKKHTLYTRQAI